MDGASLLDRDPVPTAALRGGAPVDPFTAVRTAAWHWVEYMNGERELYDMTADPYQLTSRHKDPALIEASAALRPPRPAADLRRGQLPRAVTQPRLSANPSGAGA